MNANIFQESLENHLGDETTKRLIMALDKSEDAESCISGIIGVYCFMNVSGQCQLLLASFAAAYIGARKFPKEQFSLIDLEDYPKNLRWVVKIILAWCD